MYKVGDILKCTSTQKGDGMLEGRDYKILGMSMENDNIVYAVKMVGGDGMIVFTMDKFQTKPEVADNIFHTDPISFPDGMYIVNDITSDKNPVANLRTRFVNTVVDIEFTRDKMSMIDTFKSYVNEFKINRYDIISITIMKFEFDTSIKLVTKNFTYSFREVR